MAKMEGGCLCGRVRYEADGEPAMQVVCHCKTCQKNSGSTFSTNVAVPSESFRVTQGDVQTYDDRSGASGQVFHRRFCPHCGSHVYAGGPAYGDFTFIKAGTLDDASWVAPNTHLWCVEKMAWMEIPQGATKFNGNPE